MNYICFAHVSVIPYLLSYFHCGEKNRTCQNVEVADTYACLAQYPMGTNVGVGLDEHLENIIIYLNHH